MTAHSLPDAPLLDIAEIAVHRHDGDWRFDLSVPRFAVRRGERIVLTGPNGCGKTTLIKILALALAPEEGRYFYINVPLHAESIDALGLWRSSNDTRLTCLRRDLFGYVQQLGGLLDFLTVRQNVLLTQRLTGRSDTRWLATLIKRLDIANLLDRYPSQLSIGQRQRATIVRALAHRPLVLLADEPTGSLDSASAAWVMQLLVEEASQCGTTVILASHDLNLVSQFDFEPVTASLSVSPDGQSSEFCRAA